MCSKRAGSRSRLARVRWRGRRGGGVAFLFAPRFHPLMSAMAPFAANSGSAQFSIWLAHCRIRPGCGGKSSAYSPTRCARSSLRHSMRWALSSASSFIPPKGWMRFLRAASPESANCERRDHRAGDIGPKQFGNRTTRNEWLQAECSAESAQMAIKVLRGERSPCSRCGRTQCRGDHLCRRKSGNNSGRS